MKGLAKVNETVEVGQTAIQFVPGPEEHLHNMPDPANCWCMPDMWEVYDCEGDLWYVDIEHKWIQ